MSKGTKWNEADELITLWLYYTLTGSADKTNPEIIRIAELLGRTPEGEYRHTPSSVALKLANYKSLDPNKIGGLPNVSNDDRFYFNTYSNNLDKLFTKTKNLIKDRNETIEIYPRIPDFDSFTAEGADYSGTDHEVLAKARVDQYKFRTKLLGVYNGKCCLSGIGQKELLIASHIKPWAVDISNRTNPCNGLLLNALLDRAFDQGLFSLNPSSLKVIVSSKIKDSKTREYLDCFDGQQITPPDNTRWRDCLPSKEFLQYHNDCIFEKQ
jgi:Predicted restriction endonuclease